MANWCEYQIIQVMIEGGGELRKGDFTEKNDRYSSKGPRIDFTSFRNICVYTHYSTGNNPEVNRRLSDHS